MTQILYPDENPQVERLSSIDQFKGFFSAYKQGGWAPIVFDKLDGITCDDIKTHPVVIGFSDDIGYVYPEAHCTFTSDKFIYVDKEGVEKRPLPSCFGGGGQFYDVYIKSHSFTNFDDDSSLGVHESTRTRVGLSYVRAKETLPAVDAD